MALLEIGLEEEGHVTGGGVPFAHLGLEGREVPGAQPIAPGGPGLGQQRVGHLGLAPDPAAVEEPERHPHVVGRGREHLGRPAHRMVEVHPFIPHRVPDGVGHGPDVPVAGVDEHHIEVAVGAERAPAVSSDRQ